MEDLFEQKDAGVTETALLTVQESDKEWTLVGKIDNWEDFFMDECNFLPVLNFAKERARNLVADPTTKDGQITRKALAKRIGQVEKAIAERGLEVARILKEKPKKIDAVRKRVKDSLTAYKEEVLAPLKEIEARQAEIVEIDNLPAQGIGCDSEGLKQLLEQIESMAKTPEYWKESAADAESSVREAKRQLTDMLASAEKAEAEKRELEELRAQKEAMERAAREKAEAELKKAQEEAAKAKAEAERIANEKAEAERKAKEAEEAARQAEIAKAEAERKATEAMAKLPEEERAKVDSPYVEPLWPEDERERKRKVNREALARMVELTGGDETMAKAIITAIARNEVPHVKMMYL
ncbi:hypothetical protein [Fibrobacter sp. UWH4]|uniref:hypothetical protein n=1 Tax=Fibrobacter sp. UWH4 TaxID=1896210 RepID=UPI000916EEB8|nr:hypothetical protein [Fibrobacter sp. UWH4]SHL05679.1 hypothetical protein SAMN05720762_10475 [Fibrobacter sp. UWH4]